MITIPNTISEFLKDRDTYMKHIQEHKNCCSTYYQGDDMFVLKEGYLQYYKMGMEENELKWELKLTNSQFADKR